jgi:hypothetical protein
MKKFNKQAFQQVQLDLNLIKYFFRENIIIDVENILDGFFLEIMKNCSYSLVKDIYTQHEALRSNIYLENIVIIKRI